MAHDPVNSPSHYRWHPVAECIEIVEHFPHLEATAIAYLWRAGEKDNKLEDLRKARWYIDRAIRLEERRRASASADLTGGGRGQG